MRIVNLFVLPVVIFSLWITPAGDAPAQTFTIVHGFAPGEGANPYAGLILSSNTLYGTTVFGGDSNKGTVFKVNVDGTAFTNLYSFTGGGDGANPYAGLILSGGILYGATYNGGAADAGTIFAIATDGTSFTNLHDFTGGTDGAKPYAGLTLSGNSLYGAAQFGGSSGKGAIFKVNVDGTEFTNLYSFTGTTDGANPCAGLVLSNDVLYGTTEYGGSQGKGTVFAVNTDGTSFTNLHNFTGSAGGAYPSAVLILFDSTLFGTTMSGGSSGKGTVFRINVDGTSFTNLYNFNYSTDGAYPSAGLILSGRTLYGTANAGGIPGVGTVFAISTDGTGFTNLHNFTYGDDGTYPQAGLILSSSTLYGSTSMGGNLGNGTLFSISFSPQLTITLSASNVILTWPTNVAGFDYSGFVLQSNTNLTLQSAWNAVYPEPVVVNGRNCVTNIAAGAERFYRLIQ